MSKAIKSLIVVVSIIFAGCSRDVLEMSSESMIPTLPPGAQLVIQNRMPTPISLMDVIAFTDSDSGHVFVMRVIGLPGDRVRFRNTGVYRNGILVDFSNLRLSYRFSMKPNYIYAVEQEYLVPSDHYFVVGDNFDVANDSRSIGPVASHAVLGVVRRIK
jgi:signal peptidase I